MILINNVPISVINVPISDIHIVDITHNCNKAEKESALEPIIRKGVRNEAVQGSSNQFINWDSLKSIIDSELGSYQYYKKRKAHRTDPEC